jgi:ABC-type bacteriocin/lantibiotic exporter with double-glycine peptidase domain
MDQVSYKFPNANKFLFENFNCSFDAGMVYCVTGRSGVGKSTLLELLPKLREPTKGHILIAGQNIKDVSLNSLRDIITFCSCDPKFLGLSIRKFLQSDNPQSNQELEQEIVNGLGLKELIERLPAGYDTVISDQATDFSSGQKQRIELSRALMSSKPIVIFDEPTTNLDKTNINKFIKLMTMNRFRSRKIIIIISHDEEMSGIADHVLHLN